MFDQMGRVVTTLFLLDTQNLQQQQQKPIFTTV